MTKTVKTIMLSLTDIRTYVWAAEYDSWNRVRSMTYPDKEKITCTYNAAGNLQAMSGEKEGESYPLINHQGYDKFGQMIYRKAGNSKGADYTLSMNYDMMGNILKKEQTVNGSSVASTHTYHYIYDRNKANSASMIGSSRYDIPANWPQPSVKNKPGDVPGSPVQYGSAINPDDVEPGCCII